MFSSENNMDPGPVPPIMSNLTLVEQQLVCRISPAIQVHMLKHGGIAANGHCVTFPQNVNEPAQILPNLPENINLIRVRRQGKNNTSKDFNVRRFVVQGVLEWLKANNPAYSDITICPLRLNRLPENAQIDIDTIEAHPSTAHTDDQGPASEQVDPGEVEGDTASCVPLPDTSVNIKEQVTKVVEDAVSPDTGSRKAVTIPWPTRDDVPLSEFTTRSFFTLAFPCLFPHGVGDFHINRTRTCHSMSDWAEHLMWYKDGRFAQHKYFKFIVHNMIMRKRTLEQSTYIVKQQLGDEQLTISDLKQKLQNGDTSIAKKILYFGASLRGTSQYWAQRSRELRSLIQFQINEGNGLPSFFTTGSCAEYHYKPLRRLLEQYTAHTTGTSVDLSNRNTLFSVLQKNTHIVSQYFEMRTQSYFRSVMRPVFGVNAYWYRQEFAKSRGMVHWHGLCWRTDREPHNLLHQALERGLTMDECAAELSTWATSCFGMTASHPAGKDNSGQPNKNLWAPPEGTAPAPPEEKNPLLKMLMDVSDSQESLLEDHLLLTNRINIHRCSDYCLTNSNRNKHSNRSDKICRLEFGSETKPGKELRETAALVKDKNSSLRLAMARDHPMLVQHSKYHTQGWRANGDISLIISKSGPDNPSVNEIIATEKYITGYACKGNQPTGALVELFNDLGHSADEASGATAKSVCTKLLMNTIKRDVSSMEAAYELLSLPLYRCSHQFQNISFSGSRVLERTGATLTKSTPLDKYLARHKEDSSSWYQFISKQGKVPVINGCSVRAVSPLTEDYCRSMLLLHWKNWRHISDIKEPSRTWVEIMDDFLKSEDCPNFVKADVERAHRHESADTDSGENLDEDAVQHDNASQSDHPEWMDLLQPPCEYDATPDFVVDDGGPTYDWSSTVTNYPKGLGLKWLAELDTEAETDDTLSLPDVSIEQLNTDQRFAFNIVMDTLIRYESKSAVEPLRLIVAGTAGSGKSFLIKCLVRSIRQLFATNKAVHVLCPTGNSANLISGVTIHSFLKIPTNTNAAKEMVPPDGTKGDILQSNCCGAVALIVDERSMVGSTTLGWMEFMCQHGMDNTTLPWGGIPVVVFLGDDVQLPPVCDSPVYFCRSKTAAAIHGSLVWNGFTHAVTLNTIIRQNNDQQRLKSVLSSLRQYKATKQDTQWLQQFQWDSLKLTHGIDLLTDMKSRGLFVFPTHNAESNHNRQMLLAANVHAPVAIIMASNTGQHAKTAASDKAGGLVPVLYLCRGSKVMLTSNINVPFGLYNGSMGRVTDIIYLDGRGPTNSMPDVVMVEFDKYTGPPFLDHSPNLVPIVPLERRIDCHCYNCKRTQVPLRLGWGTTIHRCQGMTIGESESNRYIVIDPGTKQFESRTPGALFVALSRAKTAGGPGESPDFAWHPDVLINEDRICHVANTPTTKARNKEIARIRDLTKATKQYFHMLDSDDAFIDIQDRLEVLTNTMERMNICH